MTTIEERTEYLNNPFFEKHLYGNWSPFYRTITVCMVLLVVLLLLNFFLGCLSKYKDYWQDRHTGNRWITTIWTATPHKQPPLDLTELEDVRSFQPINVSDSSHSRLTMAPMRISFNNCFVFFFQSLHISAGYWTSRRDIPSSSPTRATRLRSCISSTRARWGICWIAKTREWHLVQLNWSTTTNYNMIWLAMFPGVAFLVMFILIVIMVLLRYGPRLFGVRHHTLPDEQEYDDERAYHHSISQA